MPYFLGNKTLITVGIIAFGFVISSTTFLQMGAWYQYNRRINQIKPSTLIPAIIHKGLSQGLKTNSSRRARLETNNHENQESAVDTVNVVELKDGHNSVVNHRKDDHVMIPKLSMQHAVLGVATSLIIFVTWMPFVICLYLVHQLDNHTVVFTTILWYMTGLFMFCLYGFCETKIRKELFSMCCKLYNEK